MFDLWRQIGYRPHAAQLEFHDAPQRFQLLVAGARFGKSLAVAMETLRELASMPLRGWLVAPTYALARPEFRFMAAALSRAGLLAQARDGGRAGPCRLRTTAGAEVWGLSAQRPQVLLGEELDWLALCEAAHLDNDTVDRVLRPRLTTRQGRLLVTTTPRGQNWVHRSYLHALQGEPWRAFRFPTWRNPLIPPTEIALARTDLPADVFDEQFGGEFMARSGRVYSDFDPALHVARNLCAPAGSLVVRGIDYGFTNPTACVWVAQDKQGQLLVLHELYLTQQTSNDLAPQIAAVDASLRKQGLLIGPAYADPSGPGQSETLRRLGLNVGRADNEVLAGIDLVRAALKRRTNGQPGLRMDSRCVNLLREIESYTWLPAPASQERVPQPQYNHALDALRYAVVALARKVGWKAGAQPW
ncbi:MAG: hypothetical protein IPP14_04920 [Planctomycetes bacterium]|nr:hypothetical protein [Planctomycetota bacterium]